MTDWKKPDKKLPKEENWSSLSKEEREKTDQGIMMLLEKLHV